MAGLKGWAVEESCLSLIPRGVWVFVPGDTIVVPVNEDYQPTLTKYREVTTVVFNSIASLFPLFRL